MDPGKRYAQPGELAQLRGTSIEKDSGLEEVRGGGWRSKQKSAREGKQIEKGETGGWGGSRSNVTSKAGKTCGEITMENSGGKTTNWKRKRIEYTRKERLTRQRWNQSRRRRQSKQL